MLNHFHSSAWVVALGEWGKLFDSFDSHFVLHVTSVQKRRKFLLCQFLPAITVTVAWLVGWFFFLKYCKTRRLTSNFIFLFCILSSFLKILSVFLAFFFEIFYFLMFIPFTTALTKKKFPHRTGCNELCSKECVFIFAQKKENKLCTHTQFFICRQTSLFNCLKLFHSQPLRGTVGSSFSGKKSFSVTKLEQIWNSVWD